VRSNDERGEATPEELVLFARRSESVERRGPTRVGLGAAVEPGNGDEKIETRQTLCFLWRRCHMRRAREIWR